ncbi:MAG: rod shape-determining protein RodA [Chloroherpetonaceae bacterium]|nr:rod shape-determining protein RodA [Chloroherpetonaceae bacterium]MDW8020755.1 rod shape-determining protein RodA [Chloroherpetonaceae bacterium]
MEYELRTSKPKLVDWLTLLTVAALIGFGLMAIYSASHGVGVMTNFHKQLVWLGIGAVAMLVVMLLPYRFFQDWAYPLYALSILALVAVLILGRKVAGSLSWIQVAGANIQPSELAKLTTILALARYLSARETDIRSLKGILVALSLVLLPVILILLQPDTGTALTYLTFIVPMIVIAGFEFYYVLVAAVPIGFALIGFLNLYALAVAAGILLLMFLLMRRTLWLSIAALGVGIAAGIMTNLYAAKVLRPHQLKRIQTFLDPMLDPQGAGYNALQAKVAIGSGGLFGKGFLQGTQTQLRFIPAQWTDFIFCVIGEEFGFIGAATVLVLFFILMLRIVSLATSIINKFSVLALAGIASLLLGHIVINVGMTIGLLPVIGIPLPFLSYGGSSLLANLIAIGFILNVYRNRRDLAFS